jgi:transglutaminase-like putative cysteine protease
LRRTIPTALVAAAVIAIAWLRLESPADSRATWLVLIALLPLFSPWLVVPALVLAAPLAFHVWPNHPLRLVHRFDAGFLDFYDVKTPFDPRVQAEMRGVVLTAVFGFVVALALAIRARRPVAAAAVLLVGAGWPATLAGTRGGFALGVAILVALLAVFAVRVPRAAIPVTAAVVLAAVAASTAVAQGGLVNWQRWDFYNAPDKPVSVSYVWDARYDGIRFPAKRTTVLDIDAPPRSLFWRAAVLDSYADDRWVEVAPVRGDSLEPRHAPLLAQRVHVAALSDTRLVGASVPVSFDAGDAPIRTRVRGFATLPSGLTRGFTYSVRSAAPNPTAAQLGRVPAQYPAGLASFREVWPGIVAPPFGAERETFLDGYPDLSRYVPLLRASLAVAGRAHTPYAAAAALQRWFRSSGGFTYSSHPPLFAEAPLVGFVVQTRTGYCQHFAGAMALMLRYLGVPARVAVGFSSGTYDRKHGSWRVTDHDAHAWVEVWFRGYGWLPFDPTPSTGRPERGTLSAPYASPAAAANIPIGTLPVTGGEANRQTDFRHGEVTAPGTPQAPETAPQRTSHPVLLFLVLLVVAAVLLIAATKLVVRSARYVTRDPRRVAAACRQELADYLLDQRIEGARSATLHELGELVRDELTVDPDAFVAAATAARFGRPEGAPDAARRARRELRALLRMLRTRLTPQERALGLLSLRSLGFTP